MRGVCYHGPGFTYYIRQKEEVGLRPAQFVGYTAKGLRHSILATGIIGIAMGLFLAFVAQSAEIGMVYGVLGIVAFLTLPTYYSYRCYCG